MNRGDITKAFLKSKDDAHSASLQRAIKEKDTVYQPWEDSWEEKERKWRLSLQVCAQQGRKMIIVSRGNEALYQKLADEFDVQIFRCETKEEIPDVPCSVIWVPPIHVKL